MSLSILDKQIVRERAQGYCEYCLVHEDDFTLTFQVDHIIPLYHGGNHALENLAWSCPFCNNRKGTNLAGIDPQTGEVQRLYRPHQDHWEEHFVLHYFQITGLTPIGRATVSLMKLNRPDALIARQVHALF